MKRFVICCSSALMVLALSVSGCASEQAILGSASCSIASPPIEAGVNAGHGALIRVHPRRSNISADFTGCQTIWMQSARETSKMQIVFRSGRPIAMVAAGLQCRYIDGKLSSGGESECPRSLAAFPSEPADCLPNYLGGSNHKENCDADDEDRHEP